MDIFSMMDDDVLLVGQGGGMLSVECLTGIMRAFEERGVIPGKAYTSSGSTLFSSLYYSGHDSFWFHNLMETRDVSDFFSPCIGGSLSTVVSCGRHMFNNDGVKKLLEEEMTGAASLRVTTSLTRLIDWEMVSMPATPSSALAATSIPYIFKPVEIQGTLYVDGGVINNIPVPSKEEIDDHFKHVFVFLCPDTVYNDTTEDSLITGLLELLDAVKNREIKKLISMNYFDDPRITLIQPKESCGGGLLNWSPDFALREHCYELAKGLI